MFVFQCSATRFNVFMFQCSATRFNVYVSVFCDEVQCLCFSVLL